MSESTVSLRELIIRVLERWRAVIAAALVFAFILGCAKAVTGFFSFKAGSSSEAVQKYEDELKQYEAEKESVERAIQIRRDTVTSIPDEIDRIEKLIDDTQKYINDSILMNLDPASVRRTQAVVYINVLSVRDSYVSELDAVQKAYTALCEDDSFWQGIVSELSLKGVKPEHLSEVAGVKLGEQSNNETQQAVIYLSSMYPDDAVSGKIVDALWDRVNAASAKISAAVCPHTLSLIGRQTVLTVDPNLRAAQQEEIDVLDSLLTDKDNQSKRFTAALEDITALTKAKKLISKPSLPAVSLKVLIKNAVIYAVIGAVFGAAAAVFVVLCLDAFTSKVRSPAALARRCDARVFTALPERKKRFGYRFDGCIERLELVPVHRGNIGEAYAMLAVYLLSRAESSVPVKLLCAGDGADDAARELEKSVKSSPLLAGRELTVESSCGLSESASACEKAAVCGSTVLVGRLGGISFSELENELCAVKSVGGTVEAVLLV